MRFFTNPRKPVILALARPDPKRNIMTLVKVFGECRPLREIANLTLILGNCADIDEMPITSASILTAILKIIDIYDLYGQVAYPKHHRQSDVPDIYRQAAKTNGVFINPAFIEPFGLTLIEAAAYGLHIVATKNGGLVDIHRVLDNGLLVDPHDQDAIIDALYKLVSDKQLWARGRQIGLKNIHLFSWPEHCKRYLFRMISCRPRHPQWQRNDNDGFENSETDSPMASETKDMENNNLPDDGIMSLVKGKFEQVNSTLKTSKNHGSQNHHADSSQSENSEDIEDVKVRDICGDAVAGWVCISEDIDEGLCASKAYIINVRTRSIQRFQSMLYIVGLFRPCEHDICMHWSSILDPPSRKKRDKCSINEAPHFAASAFDAATDIMEEQIVKSPGPYCYTDSMRMTKRFLEETDCFTG